MFRALRGFVKADKGHLKKEVETKVPSYLARRRWIVGPYSGWPQGHHLEPRASIHMENLVLAVCDAA